MSNPEKNKFDIICNTVDNGIIVLNPDYAIGKFQSKQIYYKI